MIAITVTTATAAMPSNTALAENVIHARQGGMVVFVEDVWQVFDHNRFYTLQSSQSKDRQYILTISCVRAE